MSIPRDATLTVKHVTLWVCDECGYYRSEESTGRHQTANPRDPRGPMLRHTLVPVRFIRDMTEGEDT